MYKKLDVYLPTGYKQISANDLVIKQGEKVLIKGKTGAGKTTLFRVLAGIWPFGAGEVVLPKARRSSFCPRNLTSPSAPLWKPSAIPCPQTPTAAMLFSRLSAMLI